MQAVPMVKSVALRWTLIVRPSIWRSAGMVRGR